MSIFKKAEKTKSKLKLGLTGPSGSGKTFSALRLAAGIGGRVAVIDTENGSASLYSDKFNFDVLELAPPFTTEKFINAIKAAEGEKYDVIIIDSISHQWAGDGGLLRKKEELDQNPKANNFANWAKITPVHDRFVSTLVQCKAHLIVTMRSKEEYLQIDDGGKKKIARVGMSPIQRDGIIYELTSVFDINLNHDAESTKDRTGLFVDKTFKVTEETGAAFKTWLESGKEVIEQPTPEPEAQVIVLSDARETKEIIKQNHAAQESLKTIIKLNEEVKEQPQQAPAAPAAQNSNALFKNEVWRLALKTEEIENIKNEIFSIPEWGPDSLSKFYKILKMSLTRDELGKNLNLFKQGILKV